MKYMYLILEVQCDLLWWIFIWAANETKHFQYLKRKIKLMSFTYKTRWIYTYVDGKYTLYHTTMPSFCDSLCATGIINRNQQLNGLGSWQFADHIMINETI